MEVKIEVAKSPIHKVVRLKIKMNATNNNKPEKEPLISDLLNEIELPIANSK